MTDEIRAARAALHLWEEPCISGKEGSGAVFFSGCPMGCVFCQNHDIALAKRGQVISKKRLCEIYLELQRQGANNINLVTPTQYVPQIIETVKEAKKQGLSIPIVYNTGSCETAETIRILRDVVDIFLPDLKYFNPELARRYANMPSYFEAAVAAIDEMVKLTGPCVFDERGMMVRGTIVRHLILPAHTKDSKAILHFLKERYQEQIYISIMNQYTPMAGIKERYPELGRRVTKREYERVLDYAIEIGIEQAFVQEGQTASESFIPLFDGTGLLQK